MISATDCDERAGAAAGGGAEAPPVALFVKSITEGDDFTPPGACAIPLPDDTMTGGPGIAPPGPAPPGPAPTGRATCAGRLPMGRAAAAPGPAIGTPGPARTPGPAAGPRAP